MSRLRRARIFDARPHYVRMSICEKIKLTMLWSGPWVNPGRNHCENADTWNWTTSSKHKQLNWCLREHSHTSQAEVYVQPGCESAIEWDHERVARAQV